MAYFLSHHLNTLFTIEFMQNLQTNDKLLYLIFYKYGFKSALLEIKQLAINWGQWPSTFKINKGEFELHSHFI